MTSACSSSTATSSSRAAIATICWASTSSGLRGTRVGSISPSRMRRATTAHSSRSARNFGKMRPFDGLADAVAGAADALQPARDRLRRLDLDHEVDGAHVDAELERGGRDQAGQLARPSAAPRSSVRSSRASEPWWARAISAAPPPGSSLGAELVQPQREALGGAAVVDEDDRRAVRADQLEQLRVDRRPDRAPRRLAADDRLERVGVGAALGLDHRLDRHADLRSSGLRDAGVDDRAPRAAARPGTRRSPRAAAASPRGRSAAAAGRRAARSSRSSVSARCAPRLVAGDGVDLVDDHRLDAGEHLARPRGQHQVERLGRGDQDVGRRRAASPRARAAACRRCGSRRAGRAPSPRSGARRLRSTS